MHTRHQITERFRGRIAATALAAAIVLTVPGIAAGTPPSIPGLTTRAFTAVSDTRIIPDNDSLIVLNNVLDFPGTIVDVDVTLDVRHTSANNLDIYLISPDGTTVTLTSDNGDGDDDVYSPVVFDDQAPVVDTMDPVEAAENARNADYQDTESIGTVQPEGALGALIGESAEGPWVLVVTDDSNGSQGTLEGFTLIISTVPLVQTSSPSVFNGGDSSIPNGFPEGVELPLLVTNLGTLLYDVDVTVDISHDTSGEIDLFLTSPSGTTIDLVTNIGGGNDDLYRGTTFDDQASDPISDEELPEDGAPFTAVIPEGALSRFVGENPNGIWFLTVADDSFGSTGDVNSWSLRIVTGEATCGNGVIDGIEQCDDGNPVDGDGCDSNCTPTGCGNGIRSAPEECDDGNTVNGDGCPATCAFSELNCSDCADNDGDGLVDALDPDCTPAAFSIATGKIGFRGPRTKPKDTLSLKGGIAMPSVSNGGASLAVADANGAVTCVRLGNAKRNKPGTKMSAKGGGVTVKLSAKNGGTITVKGKRLNLSALDDATVRIGLQLGPSAFSATTPFRARNTKRWSAP
jgi:cysteine-rich repeat protein